VAGASSSPPTPRHSDEHNQQGTSLFCTCRCARELGGPAIAGFRLHLRQGYLLHNSPTQIRISPPADLQCAGCSAPLLTVNECVCLVCDKKPSMISSLAMTSITCAPTSVDHLSLISPTQLTVRPSPLFFVFSPIQSYFIALMPPPPPPCPDAVVANHDEERAAAHFGGWTQYVLIPP
jgi:hypothetical protein